MSVSLVKFHARNHIQQIDKRGPRPEIDDRTTPPGVFDPLHARFRFSIDVACTVRNARLPRYFTEESDGLSQPWTGERVWCNPPFSSIAPWVEKAWREAESADLIVMLLPANRTEQIWWQRLVEPHRDRARMFRVEFLPGRLRFIAYNADSVKPNERPPFGCCLLIWNDHVLRATQRLYPFLEALH